LKLEDAEEFSFCQLCKCEISICERPRLARHGKVCNFHGRLQAEPEDRAELIAVARQGHEFRSMEPIDVTVHREAGQVERVESDFMLKYTCMWFKEPVPVRQFLELADSLPAEYDAEQFVDVILELVDVMHDRREQWVHKQISRKRMAFTMGFTMWCRHVGILHDIKKAH